MLMGLKLPLINTYYLYLKRKQNLPHHLSKQEMKKQTLSFWANAREALTRKSQLVTL
jgi:hypothetical protein